MPGPAPIACEPAITSCSANQPNPGDHKDDTMSSRRPKKKIKTTKDAEVSVGGRRSGGIRLTPELVARVATFADAVCSSDVINICVAVGPDNSRTVQHYYLWRNEKYLAHTILRLFRGLAGRRAYEKTAEKACSNHLAWMKVNADWRTIAVRDDLIEKLKISCEEIGPGEVPTNIVDPFIAFNNPAVAIQFGLFHSLKHLVEDKGIDINSFDWTEYGNARKWHLLYYAAKNSQKKIFKYFLNLPDLNLRCKANEVDTGSSVFLKLLDLGRISSEESGSFEHPFLRMFIQHPEFDINGQIIPMDESQGLAFVTPLACAALLFARIFIVQFDQKKFQSTYQGTRILLSAGANPHLSFQDIMSPIAYLRYAKRAAQMGNMRDTSLKFFEANERYWEEAMTLLESTCTGRACVPR